MRARFSAAARPDMITELERALFDVLVIGGGITGAGSARDAAMRGLAVALVERDDFGSGTSSRSSRLVHGGLRYLEHGDFHLVFESSRERRILLRIAPHLVRPQAFIWPVYEDARVPAWKLAAGLFVYDALALFRNVGPGRRLPVGTILQMEPAIRQAGLVGGARYFDAATDDSRLTLANARAAAEAGAAVANHVEVRELVTEGGTVKGAVIVDALTGRRIQVAARAVINASGPWSDAIRQLADPEASQSLRRSKGVHLAVPRARLGNQGALTILSPIDGRVMFILPAGSLTIVGTTETDYTGPVDRVRATRDDLTYLLRSANAYFPNARLTPDDVVSVWAGIRPLVASDGDADAGSTSREHAITWTTPGLVTVSGGKLTTYRCMAAEVVDEVVRTTGLKPRGRASTHRVPLPGGDFASLDAEVSAARAALGSPAVAEHLVHAYGTGWREIAATVEKNRTLGAPVAPNLPYIVAELHYAVEREMAVTLADLLIRRLHVAFETRDHGIAAAPGVARAVAALLQWRADQIEAELIAYGREIARIFNLETD